MQMGDGAANGLLKNLVPLVPLVDKNNRAPSWMFRPLLPGSCALLRIPGLCVYLSPISWPKS